MITTFFTPSYRNDLDRAIWMRRSINRFFKDRCRHIMAVPRSDIPVFTRSLRHDANVEIVSQEEVVSRIFYPDQLYKAVSHIAKSQLWRFEKHAGRSGWIIQQIVKLNCAHWIEEGAVAFIDSDVIFTRPFGLHDLGVAGTERALVRITPKEEGSRHRIHINQTRKILSLPPGSSEHHYMSCPAIWYIDWIKVLHSYLEGIAKTDWQTALFRAKNISEYTIYGIFVEEVLKPENLVLRTAPFHKIIWDKSTFEELKSNTQHHSGTTETGLSLVIQSNLGIPTTEYEDVLRRIID